jgi:hypothetical protein
VHKSPVTLRPVVNGVNSLLAVFSNWLDYKLKKLLPYVKSYNKDSTTVIKELKELTIPTRALLFSADATSMYTNIETHLAVDSIKSLILDNRQPPMQLPYFYHIRNPYHYNGKLCIQFC